MTVSKVRSWLWIATVVLVAGILAVLLAGELVPNQWTAVVILIGHSPGQSDWQIPPFRMFSVLEVYSANGQSLGTHFYLLGSDGAGRDLFALVARGTWPSLQLVLVASVARFAIGISAGIAMALGSRLTKLLSRAANRWFAGIPQLAFAIVLIQILSSGSRFQAFVIALALIGWREIAETTSTAIQTVMSRPFAEAARSLGSGKWQMFKTHVLPFLVPALLLELPSQAGGILVLIGEMGFLNVYLGAHTLQILGQGNALSYRVPATPELGALVSGARQYILREEWGPVLVPALALGLFALVFELIAFTAGLERAEGTGFNSAVLPPLGLDEQAAEGKVAATPSIPESVQIPMSY